MVGSPGQKMSIRQTPLYAAEMVDWEKVSEELSDESSGKLFPFIRKTLLTAAMWAKRSAETASIPEMELLKSGLGRGLFALQCSGIRNFSRVEWQIRREQIAKYRFR